MIIKATTETGSIYILDMNRKLWRKERMPVIEDPFFPVRSQSGIFTGISKVEVGKPITMTGKPLDKRATFRLITTSHVVKVEECDSLPE